MQELTRSRGADCAGNCVRGAICRFAQLGIILNARIANLRNLAPSCLLSELGFIGF